MSDTEQPQQQPPVADEAAAPQEASQVEADDAVAASSPAAADDNTAEAADASAAAAEEADEQQQQVEVDDEEDLEGALREQENDINETVRDMGRLRGEYAFNLRKLQDSYYPRMFPYLNAVHMNSYYQGRLTAEISWLEQKVVGMEQHQAGFFELRDMATAKKQLFDGLTPRFEDALLRMQGVSREELAVLRGYDNPPQIVLDTIAAVMTVRGEEDTSLDAAKVMLSETYYYSFFVTKCRNRVKAELSDEQADALERYLLSPESEPEKVARSSVPCAAMAMWLSALDAFFHYQRVTEPTKETVAEVKERLLSLRMQLQEKREEVRGAQEKLEELSEELTAQERDLRGQFDATMVPLHETFIDAHNQFYDTFTSPRRERDAAVEE